MPAVRLARPVTPNSDTVGRIRAELERLYEQNAAIFRRRDVAAVIFAD